MTSQEEEQYLREFINSIFDKYDTEKKGILKLDQLCLFFNQIFSSLNLNLTINAYQAASAIHLVDPSFTDTATKQQAFTTFKSLINYANNKQSGNNQTQVSMQQPQMANTQMPMQMFGNYNPMMMQYYGQPQNQFNGNQGVYMQYPQYTNQGWYYGNYQNNNYQR